MGVDKPNVRRVTRAHAPRSLERYGQEVGRARRDGAPARVALLYDERDLCLGAPPISSDVLTLPDWRAGFDPAAVRAMAAVGADGPDPVGIARALYQVSSLRSRPYRTHPAQGSLARTPCPEVLEAVRETIASWAPAIGALSCATSCQTSTAWSLSAPWPGSDSPF
ncbi:MAG: hypothetical protein IT307_18420 [Chloroflexi bacterium]|nr:hypothetical protein [Chloroflexota bacterium]